MNLQPLCTLDVIESNTGEIDDNESSSYLYIQNLQWLQRNCGTNSTIAQNMRK